MNRILCFAFPILAGAVSLSPASAQVQTVDGQLNVRITIEAECELGAISDIDFGTTGVLSANVDADGSVTVTCTTGTPYSLSLDEGNGAGATEELRFMTGAGGTVSYSLYRDSGWVDTWGTGADALSGVGTGSAVLHTVYGRVGPQSTPAPGLYEDAVTVTLSY